MNPPTTAPTPTLPVRHYRDLPGPRGWPLLGNLGQIDKRAFHRSIEDGVAQWGPVYRMRLGNLRVMVISDLAQMLVLLKDRPQNWQRGLRLSELLSALGPRGVFSAEGEDWRRQRKLVTRGLNPEVIRKFHPTLAGLCERLVARWTHALKHGNAPDLMRDIKALTLDVTVALAMGEDVNTLDHPDNPLPMDIHALFERVGARLRIPLPYWKWFKLPVDRAADASAARVLAAVSGIVERTRQRIQAQPALRERPSNLMEAFITARDEPDSGVTDVDVIGNALTMVFAGEDTTSSTLCWAVHLLSHHPEVTRKLTDEVDTVLGDARVPAEATCLERLVYTEAVVHEVLRLKPAAPMLVVEAAQDRMVGDVLLPAGVLVMMPTRVAPMRADAFEAPTEFRPERWLGQLDVASDAQRRMLPFGAGPRLCPGRYLALVEAKTVLAAIVRNFNLTPVADAESVKEFYTFTMNPSHLPVTLARR